MLIQHSYLLSNPPEEEESKPGHKSPQTLLVWPPSLTPLLDYEKYTKFQYWSKWKKCKKVKPADVQPLQVSLPPHIIRYHIYFLRCPLSELVLPPPSKHPQGASSIQWEGKVGEVLCGFTWTALTAHTPQQICLLQKLESKPTLILRTTRAGQTSKPNPGKIRKGNFVATI